jgi:PD-(D/E)XK nuclease superfamily
VKLRVLQISITELLEYLRCRRAWDLQSANRQSLVRKGAPATALWMGQAMHIALAAQLDGLDWHSAFTTYVEKIREDMALEYLRKVGAPMSLQEWQHFNESVELMRQVLVNYYDKWGTPNPFAERGLRALATELTFRIPLSISTPNYDEVYLVGTIDVAFLDSAGDLGAGDHKSFSQSVDLRDLQRDFQFTGYCACLQFLVHEEVRFFIYNGVNKKVPTKPRILTGDGPRKGKLSKDKGIATTELVYRQAILDNGEDPADYAEHLAWLALRDKEANPFFTRHRLTIGQAQMRDWWDTMIKTVTEIANDPPIIFNRRWEGCWDCNVRDLCDTIMDDGDVEWLKQDSYAIGTYGTQQTLQNTVSPETVSSVADLIKYTERKH